MSPKTESLGKVGLPNIEERCPTCRKLTRHCVCANLKPISSKLQVLILQHPREQKQELNSAFIPALTLPSCVVRVGLSWPNIGKAWGSPTDPRAWIALFIGKKGVTAAPDEVITVLNKKSEPHPDRALILKRTSGIIILDGTWAEAKTLWWRNSWLTKVPRAVLNPPVPRMYGTLRQAARREGISTVEAVAWCMHTLKKEERQGAELREYFQSFLNTF